MKIAPNRITLSDEIDGAVQMLGRVWAVSSIAGKVRIRTVSNLLERCKAYIQETSEFSPETKEERELIHRVAENIRNDPTQRIKLKLNEV